ncbi:hypothetical protein NDU88_000720 [Pleurodeles waltl]|uniref:Secreted protein n=1 Tax=Pleurodeles waltl TaxID=8319 RepID=A0AAV7UQS2_PLEWA|nr:hypothetical protein NDU88_000720 [Pleurodeles waltl]
MAVQVAVPAPVSAAEMLPVLPVLLVLVVVEGDTSPSPAALDDCPLGMMLVTVIVAAVVQGAVQMAVQVVVVAAVLTVATAAEADDEIAASSAVQTPSGPVDNGGQKHYHHIQT